MVFKATKHSPSLQKDVWINPFGVSKNESAVGPSHRDPSVRLLPNGGKNHGQSKGKQRRRPIVFHSDARA